MHNFDDNGRKYTYLLIFLKTQMYFGNWKVNLLLISQVNTKESIRIQLNGA